MGAELFHADGQTDMMMLVVAFRNFADALNVTTPPAVKKKKHCANSSSRLDITSLETEKIRLAQTFVKLHVLKTNQMYVSVALCLADRAAAT